MSDNVMKYPSMDSEAEDQDDDFELPEPRMDERILLVYETCKEADGALSIS